MLVIHPKNPEECYFELHKPLLGIQFIAEPWKGNSYLVGNRFMQHISFAGCMPYLQTLPDQGVKLCHVELPEITTKPVLVLAATARPPRCPHCNNLIQRNDGRAQCSHCNIALALNELLWGSRKSCFTRQRIHIHQIERGDAAPTDEFLGVLEEKTGFSWDYAFL